MQKAVCSVRNCDDPMVRSLLAFVAARTRGPASGTGSSYTDSSTDADLRSLSTTLLAHARKTCSRRSTRSQPCDLTSSQLRTLARIARLYDTHSDFDRDWLAFLSLSET